MDIAEVKKEIERLENGETNWQNIERLSWLYAVHDHIAGDSANVVRIEQDKMPDYAGEFGAAVSGKNIGGVMNVLTEHMAVIKVLHPKEYQAVLDRIAEIP
jgi:hypothetical protein